jgi:hypothetical protein
MKAKLIGRTSVCDNIKLKGNPPSPVFRELHEKQKKAIWFPEELNIKQDALDYRNLSPDEKDLFDTAVGYFCSSKLLEQNLLVQVLRAILLHNIVLEVITKKLTETAFLAKYAGGVGMDISCMRATGSHTKSLNAKSSGMIPFIKVFAS